MDRIFRAADAAETDTFSAVVVQDFYGLAIEDGDDKANEFSAERKRAQQ
jgi:hypothetical protein